MTIVMGPMFQDIINGGGLELVGKAIKYLVVCVCACKRTILLASQSCLRQ